MKARELHFGQLAQYHGDLLLAEGARDDGRVVAYFIGSGNSDLDPSAEVDPLEFCPSGTMETLRGLIETAWRLAKGEEEEGGVHDPECPMCAALNKAAPILAQAEAMK